ncbi:hypothetical protein RSOLAG22IIIB_09185 [Rhizoctonia solani]|uniref:Uncharacterized protein n=1 Tax=Rhizoctonia solani TaxID=456999 RepID=A0A0K6FXU4_9AGAM|nr:hypothetical protein RSOLAG22IIIB_09185 [Rhizoctonia solani]
MSGARFSLFGDDESEDEVPPTPVPGAFPSPIPPPISADPLPVPTVPGGLPLPSHSESSASTPAQNTSPVPSGSPNIPPNLSTPGNGSDDQVIEPDPVDAASDIPPIHVSPPQNGASASNSSSTSVATTPTTEEPAHPPGSINGDPVVTESASETSTREETPPIPELDVTSDILDDPMSTSAILAFLGPAPGAATSGPPNIPQPHDTPLTSDERAQFAADTFLATGDLEAAGEAIAELKNMLNTDAEVSSARRAELTEVLSSILSQRFEHFGDVDDMEEAVETQMQLAQLAMEDGADPDLRAKSHGGLGRTLTAQFEHTGDIDDADLAIDHLNQALDMMPPGHPGRPTVLADLAKAELAHYAHKDDPSRLQQALARCEEALSLISADAPERTPLSGLLGGALISRFERTHRHEDIARAVEYLEFAVTHTPEGNPERPKRMRSHGDAILSLAVIENDWNGLNTAIGILETALELLTTEHAAYPIVSGSLAKAFHTRYRNTNNVEDLDKAIDQLKTTVEYTPFTDPNHARITDLLGKSFMAKYRAATQPPRTQFLEYAITLHRQAVALTPPEHRHYPGRLESLGKAYSKRYRSMLRRHSAQQSDLHEAERCLREAMERDSSRRDNILHELGKLNQP